MSRPILIEARASGAWLWVNASIQAAARKSAAKIEDTDYGHACQCRGSGCRNMSDICILSIRRGALYFARDVYERYFNALDNVVLLRDGTRSRSCCRCAIRRPADTSSSSEQPPAIAPCSAQIFSATTASKITIEMTLPAAWSDDRAALVAVNSFD